VSIVEKAMEVYTVSIRRTLDDRADARDHAQLLQLSERLQAVCRRCQERSVEESRDHELIGELAREIASLADRLKVNTGPLGTAERREEYQVRRDSAAVVRIMTKPRFPATTGTAAHRQMLDIARRSRSA
jgi:hypothetical protein